MIVKTDRQERAFRDLGLVARSVLNKLHEIAEPGITTNDLDIVAKALMKEAGVESAPIKAYSFPGYACFSVNEVAAHGIPDDRQLVDGDMLNIDVSLTRDDLWVDTGRSEVVGEPSDHQSVLLEAVLLARSSAIHAAKPGKPYRAVAAAVERVARKYGLVVVDNLGGHGTGDSLHTPPYLSNVVANAENGFFMPGQVVAIEPLLSYGSRSVQPSGDWHLVTGTQTVQCEHTVIIHNKPIILT